MTNYDQLLQTAFAAVDQAKEIFLKPAEHQLTGKGDRDYATEADYEIERVVRKQLAKATLDIGFLGEEEGHTGNTDRHWCLDPIDGTVNYSKGLPLCGISLALVEGDTPVVGVIDFPLLRNRYWACKSHGAFRDGESIGGGEISELGNAIVSVGDNAYTRNELRWGVLDVLANKALRVRMLGSAAVDLAWVADGKTDAAVIVGGDVWDLAAGTLLAAEAGVVIRRLDVGGQSIVVAARSELFKSLGSQLAPDLTGSHSPVQEKGHPS